MDSLIWSLLLLVIGFLIGRRRRLKQENQGEAAVRKALVKYCRATGSHVLNNVTLKYDNGTTQIDHILVSKKGVLVVETKHYKGWIFADENSRRWTQVIFQFKSRFQNPLHQNAKHIRAVRQLLDFLPGECIQGVVVFSGDAEFKSGMPNGVILLRTLGSFLEKFSFGDLSDNRLQCCVGRLECTRLEITGATDIEHQKFLEKKFGMVDP